MRDFLINLLRTPDQAPIEITLFSVWHILYVVLILGVTLFLCLFFQKRSDAAKKRLTDVLAILPVALYALDYLAMPLAYGEISVDKLPFHFCTMLSLLIPPIHFGNGRAVDFWREPITVLALVTSMMYFCYPGSAIGDITPFCYLVIQTFLFHGCVFVYGVLSLSTGKASLSWKRLWRCALLIGLFIVWASFGNAAYSSEAHHFDWCFITGSTFPFIPSLLMPLVVLGAVFGLCTAIYAIYFGCRAFCQRKKESI